MRANNKEINVKNKQLITDIMLNQHFLQTKFETRANKIILQCCFPGEKFTIFLE